MNRQEILGLAGRFAKAQASGDVLLDDFLAQEGIPKEERYEAACRTAEFLARYKFHMDKITEMQARVTV